MSLRCTDGAVARLLPRGLFALVCGLGFVFCCAAMFAREQDAGPATFTRPNLLIVAIDALRSDHTSCYGYERPTTPTLDAIAARGLRFVRARTVAPWTLPSFATMFTGRYPTRHGAGAEGAERNIGQESPLILSPEVPTMGEWLREHGFRTAAIAANPYLLFGPLRGFEEIICKAVGSDRIGALTRQWLSDSAAAEPFALFVHFNDAHEPTQAHDLFLRRLNVGDVVIDDPNRSSLERWGSRLDQTWLGNEPSAASVENLLRTKIALYDACVLRVDYELGRILSWLERQGRLERTIVVVLSDHGEEFLDHAAEQARNPRDPRGVWGIGHGHTLYEEQLRIPLVMMGPGIPVGEKVEESFPTTELMPTLLGWLDLPLPAEMDGVDRRAWLANPSRSPIPMAAEGIAYGPDRIAWIEDERKVVSDRSGEPQLVFDLRADPTEQHNLLGQRSWQDELMLRLLRWNERALAEAPPPTYGGQLDEQMRQGLRNLGYVE